jgi:hypothetical protein
MKKISVILFVGVFLAMAASSVYGYEATQGPTELVVYDGTKTYDGYTLFCPFSATAEGVWVTYLIDMMGNVVKTWSSPFAPGLYAYFLEDGNMLRGAVPPEANEADTSGLMSAGGAAGRLEDIDWNGNVVWAVDYYSDTYRQHHDYRRIFNKALNAETTIMVAWETRTKAEAEASGGDPQWGEFENGWSPDTIVEVDVNGTVIWKWSFFDHTVSDFDPGTANFGDPADQANWGKLDVNIPANLGLPGLRPDWNHINSIDYNADLGEIVVNSREHGEIYVVDHDGTFVSTTDYNANIAAAAGPAGDFVYRWGNPANYGQGAYPTFNEPGDEQIFGAHDIQWIKDAPYTGGPALPGAGNFLIFENAIMRPQFVSKSLIYEIDPYDDLGDYVYQQDVGSHNIFGNPPTFFNMVAGVSDQVVWAYVPQNSDMYSPYISGQHRLPNGNTIMCAGEEGNFVEVTVSGEVVWNYINPVTSQGIVTTYKGGQNNSVFRCYRYGKDHPALSSRSLVPIGTITGRVPLSGSGEDYDTQEPLTGFGFSGLGIGGGGGVGGAGGGSGGY